MSKDFELSSKLLGELCSRYELPLPAWLSDESKPIQLRLDLNLVCLRRAFSICYYSGIACSGPLDLFKQAGDLYLRSAEPSPEDWEMLTSGLDSKIEDLVRFFGCPFEPASEDKYSTMHSSLTYPIAAL